MLYVKNLFIEGPDCSGKTTLIDSIHRKTNYSYHIMDRSQISRSIFANLYNRDIRNIDIDFFNEILDLNNLYLFLLPRWEVIKKRYEKRGDEKHDIKSLYGVYSSFKKYLENKQLPKNIIVVKDENIDVDKIVKLINKYENSSLKNISLIVNSSALFCKNNEAINLKFTLNPDTNFTGSSIDSMSYEKEKEYYEKIYLSFFRKISDEIIGINEYRRKEGIDSRRFIYTSDTCISQVHVLCRDNNLIFNIILRSSNVRETLHHDLKFLYYMCSKAKKEHFNDILNVHMRFNLNSAHII